MNTEIRDWVSYWDSSHSIYVNARHADVHYRDIASAIIGLIPHRDARVLDYGCGEAVHADAVAAQSRELVLCEAAPKLPVGLDLAVIVVPVVAVVAGTNSSPAVSQAGSTMILPSPMRPVRAISTIFRTISSTRVSSTQRQSSTLGRKARAYSPPFSVNRPSPCSCPCAWPPAARAS